MTLAKVSARDLVAEIKRGPSFSSGVELARRVEAVLALSKTRHLAEAYDVALRHVVELLDGGENA